jgi:hypothetical protein
MYWIECWDYFGAELLRYKGSSLSRDYSSKPPSFWTSHFNGIQLYRADAGAMNFPLTLGRW